MQSEVALQKAVGGVKSHQGIRTSDSEEEADCLVEFFRAANRWDQRTQGPTLGAVTPLVEMPDGAATEEEVCGSLKNGRVESSGV